MKKTVTTGNNLVIIDTRDLQSLYCQIPVFNSFFKKFYFCVTVLKDGLKLFFGATERIAALLIIGNNCY